MQRQGGDRCPFCFVLSLGEGEWCLYVGTAGTARGGIRGYRGPLRAVTVHALKSLKLQDSLSRVARAIAGEMLEFSMKAF